MPYAPTIITDSTPAVQVTMGGNVTYEEFLNSLNNYSYQVNELYIQTSTREQLNQPIAYNIFDANGTQFNQAILVEIDPDQTQNAKVLDLKQQGVVLNGRSSFNLNLMPGETINLIFWCSVVSIEELTALISKANYKMIADPLGNLELYNTTRTYPIRVPSA